VTLLSVQLFSLPLLLLAMIVLLERAVPRLAIPLELPVMVQLSKDRSPSLKMPPPEGEVLPLIVTLVRPAESQLSKAPPVS